MNQTTTLQDLKKSLINYTEWVVKSNTYKNGTYGQISNKIWNEQIAPFVKDETLTGFKADIAKKIINNPYTRFPLSEKQAYCVVTEWANNEKNLISK